MPVVRYCHPHNYKDIYEFDEEHFTFTGPVGETINEVMSNYQIYFDHAMPNTTVEIHPNRGVGELDTQTNKFTGCLGELQSNLSDIILMLWEYPFDGVNITPGVIAYETHLVIGGNYDQETVGDATQLLDSFNIFSPFVWFNCFLIVLSFFLILKIFSTFFRGKARPRYTLYNVLTHCSGYGAMPSNGFLHSLLFIIASIFTLVVINYFCSSISTQLVAIKQPVAYHTYQDIIDRKAVPLFIRGMAYDQFFKKKTASPLRKKLWQYTMANFNERDLYVDIDPIAFLLCAMRMVLKQAVMVMEEPLMQVLPGSGCPTALYNPDKIRETAELIQDHERLKPLMESLNFEAEQQKFILDFTSRNPMDFSTVPDFNFHIATDPQDEKFAQSLILAENQDPVVRKHMIKVNRYLVEIGYPIKRMRILERFNMLANNPMIPALLGSPNKTRRQKMEDCFSESVILPEAHVETVSFENLRSLFIAIFCMYGLTSFVLVGEKIFRYWSRRSRDQMRQRRLIASSLTAFSHRNQRSIRRPPFVSYQ